MSLSFDRPISKAITAHNIAADVIYRFVRLANEGALPNKQQLEWWFETLRVPLAEAILPHLDAYDQRG